MHPTLLIGCRVDATGFSALAARLNGVRGRLQNVPQLRGLLFRKQPALGGRGGALLARERPFSSWSC